MDADEVPPIDKAIEKVVAGDNFFKVRGVNRYFDRKYRIDLNTSRLYYSPSIKRFFCGPREPFVDLSDAVEVRKGRNSDRFNSVETKIRKLAHSGTIENPADIFPQEEKCFSVVFANKSKTVDLVADSKLTRTLWLTALEHIIEKNKCRTKVGHWLFELFTKADKDKSGLLNFKECKKMINGLNIKLDDDHLRSRFNLAIRKIKDKGGVALDQIEFLHFYFGLFDRSDFTGNIRQVRN
ncbi:1-phosphatidylinositol 4,5-bisphosphate phosphodiesterase delta-1 [Halotydeus destructor]|nr:1-phosphatidylinositol 4,5-bisphosphate phosphodiesterase delta-1 [Halotydeus destructor]